MSGTEQGLVEVSPGLYPGSVDALRLGWEEIVCRERLACISEQRHAHIVQHGFSLWALD